MLKGKVQLSSFLICLSLSFTSTVFAEDINPLVTIKKSDAPLADGSANGRKIFMRYCSVCHGAKGEGGFGPTLQGVFLNKGKDVIVAQIKNPRGSMPLMYPKPIDDNSIENILFYLKII
jgi:mono/diheme cytochrome c family protein